MRPEIKYFRELLSASPYKNFYEWTDAALEEFFMKGLEYGYKNQSIAQERLKIERQKEKED